MKRTLISVFPILLFLVSFAQGKDIYVSKNGTNGYPYTNWAAAATNIEWAVNAGVNNDTVWISNGVYVLTNQITINSNVTICSTGGVVEVNGDGAVRCFYIPSASPAIKNITIANGYAIGKGGGIYTIYGTITNCIFTNNVCTNSGGGMYMGYPGSGLVLGCSFINNIAGANGGGLYVGNIQKVDACIFHTNTAYNGGGLYYSDGAGTAGALTTNCTFRHNVASNSYGGAYMYYGILTHCTAVSNVAIAGNGGGFGGGGNTAHTVGIFTNCTITDNIAWEGGGISAGSYSFIRNCLIASNTANYNLSSWSGGGGAVKMATGAWMYDCIIEFNYATGANIVTDYSPVLRHCLIRNNRAGGGGGVVLKRSGTLDSCTIVSNYATGNGGGINERGSGSAGGTYRNCIIYLNQSAGAGNYSNYYFAVADLPSSFSNCCFAPALSDARINYSANNITNNPLFIAPDSGNFRLSSSSPCVNRGFNRDWMTNGVDMDGKKRIRYGTVDMGVYELIYNGTIYGFQ